MSLWVVALITLAVGGLVAALVERWGGRPRGTAVAAFLVVTALAFFGYVGITSGWDDLRQAFSSPTGSAPGDADCDRSYPDVCIPADGRDLDCTDAKVPQDIKVEGRDPHGLDPDRNGVGCESDPYQLGD